MFVWHRVLGVSGSRACPDCKMFTGLGRALSEGDCSQDSPFFPIRAVIGTEAMLCAWAGGWPGPGVPSVLSSVEGWLLRGSTCLAHCWPATPTPPQFS